MVVAVVLFAASTASAQQAPTTKKDLATVQTEIRQLEAKKKAGEITSAQFDTEISKVKSTFDPTLKSSAPATQAPAAVQAQKTRTAVQAAPAVMDYKQSVADKKTELIRKWEAGQMTKAQLEAELIKLGK